jgi:hypothetical protein
MARFYFSSAMTATFTDSGGSTPVSIGAGNWWPNEVIDEINSQIGGGGSNWTVTASYGEGGTGRVTISTTDTPFDVTWTSDLYQVLGFDSDITGAVSAQTGVHHARGVWLPGVVKYSPRGDAAITNGGAIVTDITTSIGPTGAVHGLYSQSHRQHRDIRWMAVPQARALEAYEAVQGESFEAFFRDAALGRVSSYLPVMAPVRFAPDASVGGVFVEGRLLWPRDFDLTAFVDGWAGRFNVELPALVVEA